MSYTYAYTNTMYACYRTLSLPLTRPHRLSRPAFVSTTTRLCPCTYTYTYLRSYC